MTTATAERGVLAPENRERRERMVALLTRAYWLEMESVMSYLAASVNPDGVRAREIAQAIEEEIDDELDHAKRFAHRIKELYGVVPGSLDFHAEQRSLQPPERQTDVVHVIRGVIEAETAAVDHYNRIVEEADGLDWATQDMVSEILHDEEGHLRLFEGFLREWQESSPATGNGRQQ